VADYDPIRERMAAMSDRELRVAVADVENWSKEARVAAYEELCRRGVTDVSDPSTTPVQFQQAVNRGDPDGGKGMFYVGAAVVFGILTWLVHILTH
jgi:hypothetical protein